MANQFDPPSSKGVMDNEANRLVDAAQQGDRDAFRQLVEAHSQAAFRVAYRVVGDEAIAEDVVQEAFLSVYRKLPTFDGRAQFSTWLHRITVNRAIDHRRRMQRRDDGASLDDEMAVDPTSDDPRPDRLLASKQVAEATRRSLDDLTTLERTAFTLRHVEGCSIAEIGSVLDLGTSATKQAIFRAVKKLRQSLEPWTRIRHEAVS